MQKIFYMLVFLVGSQAAAQINLNNGLAGYFPLNGNAVDMSTTSINGINNGASPSTGYDGTPNGALSFVSSQSDYINVGNDYRGLIDQMSISLWFRVSGTGSYELIEKYNWQSDAGFYIRIVNGQVFFHGRDQTGIGHAPAAAPNQYNDGQWHHLVAILNITHWILYVDCQQIQDYVTTSVNPNISVNYPMVMGRYNFDNSSYLNGSLDEVRIYDRVLTTDEICYLCGNSNFFTGLTGYFPLDGNTTDLSTTSINAVNYGATLTSGFDGTPNGAYSFNESSMNYINAGNDNRGISNKMALSLWFNISGSGSYELAEKYNWNDDAGFYIRMINGRIYFHGRDHSGIAHIPNPALNTYNDGRWHHLVAIVDSIHWILYVDCEEIQDYVTSSINPDISVNYPLVFGKYTLENNTFLSGALDDIRLFDRALSPTEICNLCHNTSLMGVEEAQTNTQLFVVYPNPTHDIVRIKGLEKLNFNYTIRIHSIMGEEIFTVYNQPAIDISNYSNGIYILEIYVNDTRISTYKVIKN